METTLIRICVSQSPALFLLTLFLLICFFANQKKRHTLAVFELIFALLLLILGVALYFIGIAQEAFTIHTPGWIGLVVAGIIVIWIGLHKMRRSSAKHQEEKDAIRAANAQKLAVEQARAEAFEAGRAAAVQSSPAAQTAPAPDNAAPDSDVPQAAQDAPADSAS